MDRGTAGLTAGLEGAVAVRGGTGGGGSARGRDGVGIKGYQARSQVPIAIEYANFVELAEFAEAAATVRAHRLKMADQQQQEEQQEEQPRRRLDAEGENDKGENAEANGNDEEENAMTNAIEESWKQAEGANPEPEGKEGRSANLLKVDHVPFFWHSEYSFVCNPSPSRVDSRGPPPLGRFRFPEPRGRRRGIRANRRISKVRRRARHDPPSFRGSN